LDADSVDFVDTSACDALFRLIEKLQTEGITFAFARMRDEVRDPMRLAGIEALVGSTSFYERVTDGVRAWQERQSIGVTSAAPRR
jgi:sulfate permease, SulP family